MKDLSIGDLVEVRYVVTFPPDADGSLVIKEVWRPGTVIVAPDTHGSIGVEFNDGARMMVVGGRVRSVAPKAEAPKHFHPPFRADKYGLQIWAKDNNGDDVHMLDVRGWGYLTGDGLSSLGLGAVEADAEQRRVQQFVVDALNAAASREIDEPRALTAIIKARDEEQS